MTSYLFKSFASGILFGASLVFALIHVSLTLFHVEVPAFWHHFLPLAYVLLLFLALRKPTHLKLLEINNEIKPLLYVIEWVLGIAVFSVYLSIRYLEPQYFIIISVFISAIVVSIGWWVQSIIAAARQRRQHTVNTIIQTRISDTYQKSWRYLIAALVMMKSILMKMSQHTSVNIEVCVGLMSKHTIVI